MDDPADLRAIRAAGELLGNRLQVSILYLLARSDPPGRTLREITETMGLARQTVHRALGQLRSRGLVVQLEHEGSSLTYQADPERVRELLSTVGRLLPDAGNGAD